MVSRGTKTNFPRFEAIVESLRHCADHFALFRKLVLGFGCNETTENCRGLVLESDSASDDRCVPLDGDSGAVAGGDRGAGGCHTDR